MKRILLFLGMIAFFGVLLTVATGADDWPARYDIFRLRPAPNDAGQIVASYYDSTINQLAYERASLDWDSWKWQTDMTPTNAREIYHSLAAEDTVFVMVKNPRGPSSYVKQKFNWLTDVSGNAVAIDWVHYVDGKYLYLNDGETANPGNEYWWYEMKGLAADSIGVRISTGVGDTALVQGEVSSENWLVGNDIDGAAFNILSGVDTLTDTDTLELIIKSPDNHIFAQWQASLLANEISGSPTLTIVEVEYHNYGEVQTNARSWDVVQNGSHYAYIEQADQPEPPIGRKVRITQAGTAVTEIKWWTALRNVRRYR